MGVGTGVLRLLLETGVASSLGTSIPTKLNWMSPNDGREDGKWGDDLVILGTWTDGKRIESWKDGRDPGPEVFEWFKEGATQGQNGIRDRSNWKVLSEQEHLFSANP